MVCSRINHQNVVHFVGIHSAPEHPPALVFDFVGHLNLGTYLRSNRYARRLELVRSRCVISAVNDLTVPELALRHRTRCRTYPRTKYYPRGSQDRMSLPHHTMVTPSRSFQVNILVGSDGRARVAGLGAAYISSLLPGVEIDKFFEVHGAAPELVHPQRFGLPKAKATKRSDVHAFGAMAYEVSQVVAGSDGQAIQWSFVLLGVR